MALSADLLNTSVGHHLGAQAPKILRTLHPVLNNVQNKKTKRTEIEKAEHWVPETPRNCCLMHLPLSLLLFHIPHFYKNPTRSKSQQKIRIALKQVGSRSRAAPGTGAHFLFRVRLLRVSISMRIPMGTKEQPHRQGSHPKPTITKSHFHGP